jgi:CDP-4-dehydro-6-deoxyglucose reductase
MTFQIHLEPSGKTFAAEPNEKILEAALRQGVTLPYSCRNGSCGTCKAGLKAGSVDYGKYEQRAMSEAERGAGKVLLCQAHALSDVTVEAEVIATPAGIVIKTLPARVMKMERVAHDVIVLKLKLPEGQRLAFLAGQYIEILLKDNQRRSFSLANAPHDDEFLELHVRHVPGGFFTEHVFTKMQERDLLRFRGPLGTFFLREESTRPILFIAGGTGFAPIKAIIEHALARDIRRPMQLYWGVRAKRDLYYDALAASWAQAQAHIRYTPVLSEPRAEDEWRGATGFVHEVVAAGHADLSGHEVYACGPPLMIEAIKRTLFPRGLAPEHLHFDSFEFAHVTL